MSTKPLIINKRDTVKGIRPFCKKCSREIAGRKCGQTGKHLRSCKFPESHILKAFVTIPGASRRVRTKELGTRDLLEAQMLRKQFETELIHNEYQPNEVQVEDIESASPTLLIECMAQYIAMLNNVGVEAHMVKQRSEKHLWEVENYFEKFCKALKSAGIDHTIVRIDQIGDRTVAIFHGYINDHLKHSNKTYNKMMALMRQFMDWLIDKKGYEIKNPFKSVQRRIENKDTTIVSKDEFDLLIESINPENRYHTLPSGERKNRYKPWLEHAFRLALETGLRREEFMCLQFSDIVLDEKANPLFLKVENYKVNRIRGGKEISNEVKSVPITKGLLGLLYELGLDKHRGTDRFLIGPEEKARRNTLIEFVSKAFTHYWKQTGVEKKVMLKHLRKTYITALAEHFGDKAPMISNHSGIQVIKEHYVNSERLVAASKDFSIF